MLTEDLKIYKTLWELVTQMDIYIKEFPREYKYSHGQKLRDIGVNLVRLICAANSAINNPEKRRTILETTTGEFECYKFLKRLSYNNHSLNDKQSAIIDKNIALFGIQLNSWKQSTK